jgi:hypothetical protein
MVKQMKDDEESGGFKFAITLLAAFGTIIYASYTFFQNNAVDNNFYVVIVGVITSLLIISIFLIGYIFVKGYSMEVQDPEKKDLDNIASYIYSITFQVGAIVLLLITGIFFILINQPFQDAFIVSLIILLYIIIVIGIYLFFDKLKSYVLSFFGILKQSDEKKFTVIFVLIIVVSLWASQYIQMLGYMQGRVTIDINNIYHKNGEPIPVSIEVIGRNDNALIELYQLNSTNPIATLELETIHNSSKNLNRENSTLIGNAFYSGKYYVFINTTELRDGYYELVYSRLRDGYKYGKSFYLLNAS